MSNYIKLTDELRNLLIDEFSKNVSGLKLADGKMTFSKTFHVKDRKATVYFTEYAWLQMLTLIMKTGMEIAWHGVAKRIEDSETDDYLIEKIIVYPQEVTGATVNTDQAEYEKWMMSLEDDDFNNLRMQGHSHVNMGVSPSSTDLTHQGKILEMLDDDMFYIFFIFNKKLEYSAKVYDLKKNISFDSNDVDVKILPGEYGFGEFYKNAMTMVKERKFSYNPGQYGGYNSQTSKKNDKAIAPYNPVKGNVTPMNKTAQPKKSYEKEKKSSPAPKNHSGQMTTDDLYGFDDYDSAFYSREGFGRWT